MLLVYILYAYLITGLLTALWFCFFKIKKIDAGAKHSGIGFRLLILPAAVCLWPLVVKKVMITK